MAVAMMGYFAWKGMSIWTNANLIAAMWMGEGVATGSFSSATLIGLATHFMASSVMGVFAIRFRIAPVADDVGESGFCACLLSPRIRNDYGLGRSDYVPQGRISSDDGRTCYLWNRFWNLVSHDSVRANVVTAGRNRASSCKECATPLMHSLAKVCLVVLLFWLSLTTIQPSLAQSPNDSKLKHQYTNRLIHETSPYLLLHAHNPVDWYPWGEEALAKARRESKPIFLSVGYYTCHWCHVMERESYSSPEIAAILNRSFVAIKVDREERPDIDSTYMEFVEATIGSGGWPMNVVLTPELKPFFGGTYFPPERLKQVLTRIADLWAKRRSDIEKSAAGITDQLQRLATVADAHETLSARIFDHTFQQIKQTYDAANPGFGQSPKFPRPVTLEFLLRYWKRTGNQEALDMTLKTLHAMAAGGVHDQLGGGFHRYSTDAQWRVPHFEKMLYDQAQLAMVYTEAFQITQDSFYANVTRDILDFTLAEMRDSSGGFYSALDADSQVSRGSAKNGEGAFYVWTGAEIETVLKPEEASLFEFQYGIKKEGNVPASQDIEGWLRGKNVLREEHSAKDTAVKVGKPAGEVEQLLAEFRRKLLAARAVRPRPPVDTKVITAWNGMMISALARAGRVLNESRYLEAAKRAELLIENKLYQRSSGMLKRRYRNGVVGIDGYLDDYAWVVRADLDLYEASFDTKLLASAVRLQKKQDELFWDQKEGGYFTTPGADRSLPWRSRELYDGAEPSGTSISALNLIWIWQLTNDAAWKTKVDRIFATAALQLEKTPEATPLLAAALDQQLSKFMQIVIAGSADKPDTIVLLDLVWRRFLPNAILFLADGGEHQADLARYLPIVGSMGPKNGRATAYICENYVCNLPTADPTVAAHLLDSRN